MSSCVTGSFGFSYAITVLNKLYIIAKFLKGHRKLSSSGWYWGNRIFNLCS